MLLIGLTGCAQQVPPTGGPQDKTPPKILEVTPRKNSTLVPRTQKIEFLFSEAMNRKTLERSIFITPDPGERVRYKWKKHRLSIEYLDSLKVNTTYVITLGTDLKDAHGNSLQQSFTLAFSTGEEISKGEISGRVYSEKSNQAVLIWAYLLESGQDPDPVQKSGDYATQTGNRGRYKLANLSEGTYRIFAIRDKDKNRFYEVGTDEIAVTSRDVTLSTANASIANVDFRMVARDTLGPALISASAKDRSHLLLRFDENLRQEGSDEPGNFSVYPTRSSSKDTLEVKITYLNPVDPMEIVLSTSPQTAKTEYEVLVKNLQDLAKNPVDASFNKVKFVGSVVPDSLAPRIVKTIPADSARAVLLDAPIELDFSEAVVKPSFERNFQLQDSTGQQVSGTFFWDTPASVKFSPDRPLKSVASYFVRVAPDSVSDLFGNVLSDTVFHLTFTTINADTFSSISGTVVDEDATATGTIHLKAFQQGVKAQSYTLKLEQPGPYKFDDVLPGLYLIEGFRDQDENGEYSPGEVIPFVPAERFVVYPDSIHVRSRWPNEGNDIRFKR
ncbi:MAG: Ig-like domain-containing protein [bacterium]